KKLQTERLELRLLSEDDLEAWTDFLGDPEATRLLHTPAPGPDPQRARARRPAPGGGGGGGPDRDVRARRARERRDGRLRRIRQAGARLGGRDRARLADPPRPLGPRLCDRGRARPAAARAGTDRVDDPRGERGVSQRRPDARNEHRARARLLRLQAARLGQPFRRAVANSSAAVPAGPP